MSNKDKTAMLILYCTSNCTTVALAFYIWGLWVGLFAISLSVLLFSLIGRDTYNNYRLRQLLEGI